MASRHSVFTHTRSMHAPATQSAERFLSWFNCADGATHAETCARAWPAAIVQSSEITESDILDIGFPLCVARRIGKEEQPACPRARGQPRDFRSEKRREGWDSPR